MCVNHKGSDTGRCHSPTATLKHLRLNTNRNCWEVFLAGDLQEVRLDWDIILFGLNIFEWFLNWGGKHTPSYDCQSLHLLWDWLWEEVGTCTGSNGGTISDCQPLPLARKGSNDSATDRCHGKLPILRKTISEWRNGASNSSSRGANALSSRDSQAANRGTRVPDCSSPNSSHAPSAPGPSVTQSLSFKSY